MNGCCIVLVHSIRTAEFPIPNMKHRTSANYGDTVVNDLPVDGIPPRFTIKSWPIWSLRPLIVRWIRGQIVEYIMLTATSIRWKGIPVQQYRGNGTVFKQGSISKLHNFMRKAGQSPGRAACSPREERRGFVADVASDDWSPARPWTSSCYIILVSRESTCSIRTMVPSMPYWKLAGSVENARESTGSDLMLASFQHFISCLGS